MATEKPVTKLEGESVKEQVERWIDFYDGDVRRALIAALTYLEFRDDQNERQRKQIDWFVNDAEANKQQPEIRQGTVNKVDCRGADFQGAKGVTITGAVVNSRRK